MAVVVSGIWRDSNGDWCYDGVGSGATTRQRPPVNPWRHAYTRRKHFSNACPETTFESVDRFILAMCYVQAEKNADWGCS